jgi:hypothetical protein
MNDIFDVLWEGFFEHYSEIKKFILDSTLNERMKEEDVQYLDKFLKKAYRINKKFYGFDLKFKIKLIYTRKEMDKEFGGKTESFLSGFGWDNTVGFFAKSVFEKVTPHKIDVYQDLVTHELNHLFYQKLVGSHVPLWIQEGLAIYVESKKSNLKVYYSEIEKKHLFYRDCKGMWKEPEKSYRMSYSAVKNIMDKIGKNKFLNLLKIYSKNRTKDNYLKLFGKYIKEFS